MFINENNHKTMVKKCNPIALDAQDKPTFQKHAI